ncbi:hypothetical protein WMY93_024664 [Mugilogobius chulae]|uniref:Uncharacterized protein n=1 Tax=Mugilogobius chulae TaxID=88201 RepID=A0AAW0N4N6_9GOBI
MPTAVKTQRRRRRRLNQNFGENKPSDTTPGLNCCCSCIEPALLLHSLASSVTSVGKRDAMLQASKQLTPEKDDSAVASEGQDLQSLESLSDMSLTLEKKHSAVRSVGRHGPMLQLSKDTTKQVTPESAVMSVKRPFL